MDPKIIVAEDCYPLRSKVLRNGKSFEFCKYSEDHDPLSIHVGIVLKDRIISIASFLPIVLNKEDLNQNQFQLRGMATDPEFQGTGAGGKLVRFAETLLKNRGADLIWFNAREKAFPFYERLGYKELDRKITVSEFGPHKIMWKKI